MEGAIQLSLLSRSLGPACSNIELFFLGYKKVLHQTYGVPGGAILVQRLPVSRNQLFTENPTTEIVIDGEINASQSIEDVSLLKYNHQSSCLLSAVSPTELSILALLPDQIPSPSFRRLLSVPFPGIMAMDWTENGEALVLSDTRCQIMCFSISVFEKSIETNPLSRRSIAREVTGGMDVRWVLKMDRPQFNLVAGHEFESCVALTNELGQIKILDPSKSQPKILPLPTQSFVTGLDWCPTRSANGVSMNPCFLTVDMEGILRIWIKTPETQLQYLGSGALESEASIQMETPFRMEAILEIPKLDFVKGSMQACWVEGVEDPRLMWIAATYLCKVEERIEQHCAVFVVYGLPMYLRGTHINSSCMIALKHVTVKINDFQCPGISLRAVLLESEPVPQILFAESAKQMEIAETRWGLLSILYDEKEPLTLCLNENSFHDIVGFGSTVKTLVAHPAQDCICVLTKNRVLTIWDLWPIQNLAEVQGSELDIGEEICAMAWLEQDNFVDNLGHLVILGELGVAICLVTKEQQNKPNVTFQKRATHSYPQRTFPSYLTRLWTKKDKNALRVVFLVYSRSVDPLLDDESVSDHRFILSIEKTTKDIKIEESTAAFMTDEIEFTTLARIHHIPGGIVVGTQEGTLECFELSLDTPPKLTHQTSCDLSFGESHPSFVSCLATCLCAPYIACVTGFDVHNNEDKIHILQSESTCGSFDYRLEDSFVSSSGTVAQIAWVQTASPFLTLVVGYEAGQVDILAKKRQGLWVPVGKYISSLKLTTLTTTPKGLPILGCGRHLLFLSTAAHAFSKHVLDDHSVMQAAMSVGGTFPEYHPIPLMTYLQMGHFQSIDAALTGMTDFLKEWERTPRSERLEETFPQSINGPIGDLRRHLIERLVPELNGIHFGEIVKFEAFQSESSSAQNEGALINQPIIQAEEKMDSGLLTGQFNMSAFNVAHEVPKHTQAFEEMGLLDLSAFGMSFGDDSPIKKEVIPEPKETLAETTHSVPKEVEAIESPRVPKSIEDCVLVTIDSSFNDRFQECFSMDSLMECTFDRSYAEKVLKTYSLSTNTEDALPLRCLLKLSKNSANLLSDVVKAIMEGSDFNKYEMDIPSMKFLSAIKTIPLSLKCRPKNANSKKETSEFRREDYISPLLKDPSKLSSASKASQASVSTDSVEIDHRLAVGYVSWSESVGIACGVEAIHILWALETNDPQRLLETSLELLNRSELSEKKTKLLWDRLKSIGAGFWIQDRSLALKVADDVAKDQFKRKNDPHDCALMYIALGKEKLLGRLFRSNGFPRVADLLSKDFTKESNQQAAAKNAFVLLGQHRYSLAAAFFLIGGHIKDAIGVCAKEMEDPQLALFLMTLLDKPNKKLTNEIIHKELLPHTVSADDRVAQGLLLWLSGDPFEALEAITIVKALKSELSIPNRAVSKILLMQFVLWRGWLRLSGRYVPLWMLRQIKNVSAHCAHVLESCGLPLLALKALQTCQELEQLLPNPAESHIYEAWTTRLITAMMISHLPSAYAVNARDPALILWHQHVQEDVTILKAFGIEVDEDVIFQRMQYIMDCLFDVPSSPIFPKRTAYRPNLSGSNSRKTFFSSSLNKRASVTKEETHSKIVLESSCDLLHVEGDRCVGVCFSNDEGFYGRRNPSTKRIAVATGRHGIHCVDWDPAEAIRSSTTYGALYKDFEQSRWPSMQLLKQASAKHPSGDIISMTEAIGSPLKSHPCFGLYLSGCSQNSLLLWHYGIGIPCARFVCGSGITSESLHRFSWSVNGNRIAAISNEGICGIWDIPSVDSVTATAFPYWKHKVAPRKGDDVEFVHGSGSVLATTGEDDVGHGIFSLWDTLAPPSSSRIAHLDFRYPISEMVTIPGTLIFVTTSQSGNVQAHDFRMLGGPKAKLLWSLNGIHDGPITACEIGWAPPPSDSIWELTVATGGRDGDVCLISDLSTSGQLKQRIRKAHWKKAGQWAHTIASSFKGTPGNVSIPPPNIHRPHPESAHGLSVLDLDWCDEGLLTAGADGFVQLFPFPRHTDRVEAA